MISRWNWGTLVGLVWALLAIASAPPTPQRDARSIPVPNLLPEQRRIRVRPPEALPSTPIPTLRPPRTVDDPQNDLEPLYLSLDQALRIALKNSQVVRVFTGVGAVSSGLTRFDPASTNTLIDQAQATFDPNLALDNTWSRLDTPAGFIDPTAPLRTVIGGTLSDTYLFSTALSKQNLVGGLSSLNVSVNQISTLSDAVGLPLNPLINSQVSLSYTQPLLQGAGLAFNLAPIQIAAISTEQSVYQLEDSVQELVRGVVEAYWNLVFARTDLWARQQQVNQLEITLDRAEAVLRSGLGARGDVALARSSLATFRATLIGSRANVLQSEAALRNILGLPPYGEQRLVPISPPDTSRTQYEWTDLVRIAERNRPDLIQLKLAIQVEQTRLVQAGNLILPRLDLTGLYRWNDIGGRTGQPERFFLSSDPSQFTDWSIGLNYSVPLGQRLTRAQFRQQELLLYRSRANLQQGLHVVAHDLATNLRTLALNYQQYQAFQEARQAALDNLDVQFSNYQVGLGPAQIYLNVLQAISDWGNAVSAEAQALTSYNTSLANLQRELGVILDVHGVAFFEEQYGSVGPWGKLLHHRAAYPLQVSSTPNKDVYWRSDEPAEESFDLTPPDISRRPEDRLPDLPLDFEMDFDPDFPDDPLSPSPDPLDPNVEPPALPEPLELDRQALTPPHDLGVTPSGLLGIGIEPKAHRVRSNIDTLRPSRP